MPPKPKPRLITITQEIYALGSLEDITRVANDFATRNNVELSTVSFSVRSDIVHDSGDTYDEVYIEVSGNRLQTQEEADAEQAKRQADLAARQKAERARATADLARIKVQFPDMLA